MFLIQREEPTMPNKTIGVVAYMNVINNAVLAEAKPVEEMIDTVAIKDHVLLGMGLQSATS